MACDILSMRKCSPEYAMGTWRSYSIIRAGSVGSQYEDDRNIYRKQGMIYQLEYSRSKSVDLIFTVQVNCASFAHKLSMEKKRFSYKRYLFLPISDLLVCNRKCIFGMWWKVYGKY